MEYKIKVPLVGHVSLVKKVFMRTNDYLKTKKIMKDQYNIKIELVPKY